MRIERTGPALHAKQRRRATDSGRLTGKVEKSSLPVPVEPQPSQRRGAAPTQDIASPSAAFLTQLLATRMNLATTRNKRRATPDIADAAYLATQHRIAVLRQSKAASFLV